MFQKAAALLLAMVAFPFLASAESQTYQGQLARRAKCTDSGHGVRETCTGVQRLQNHKCIINVRSSDLNISSVTVLAPQLPEVGFKAKTFASSPKYNGATSFEVNDGVANSVELKLVNNEPKKVNFYFKHRFIKDEHNRTTARSWVEYNCVGLSRTSEQ